MILDSNRPEQALRPLAELLLKSNSQVFDARRNLFIASGDVQVTLNGGVLQADRIEFDSEFNTLFALRQDLKNSVRSVSDGKYCADIMDRVKSLSFELKHDVNYATAT